MKDSLSYCDAKKKIKEYFESRKIIMLDKKGETVLLPNGQPEYEEKPSTVTGLALALGLSRREELFEIRDKKTKALIDRALLIIEEKAEEKLFDKESYNGTKLFLETNFPRWQDNKHAESESEDIGVFSTWAR